MYSGVDVNLLHIAKIDPSKSFADFFLLSPCQAAEPFHFFPFQSCQHILETCQIKITCTASPLYNQTKIFRFA